MKKGYFFLHYNPKVTKNNKEIMIFVVNNFYNYVGKRVGRERENIILTSLALNMIINKNIIYGQI